jgi:hypothetical protein
MVTRLTILRAAGRNKYGIRVVEVECSCPAKTRKIVSEEHVRTEQVKSCGCLRRERSKEIHTTHGKYGTKKYRAWQHIVTRCTDKNCPQYPRYGGRGITMDPRWAKFENFDADMPDPPQGTSIDRKDNDGPYSKKNCRWATRIQQANNKSNSKWLTFRGRKKTVAEWMRETGLTRKKIEGRIARGWSVKDALTYP